MLIVMRNDPVIILRDGEAAGLCSSDRHLWQ